MAQFGGAVVIGATDKTRVDQTVLITRGRELDRRFKSSVRFEQMARRVQH